MGERVLVLRDKASSVRGSIILSEGAKETPMSGTVIEVSPFVEYLGTLPISDPIALEYRGVAVKKGDRVQFAKYAGTAATLPRRDENGKVEKLEVLVMSLLDIQGVITEEEEGE